VTTPCIVTAGDTRFFDLLREAIESGRAHPQGRAARLCVFDLGLAAEERLGGGTHRVPAPPVRRDRGRGALVRRGTGGSAARGGGAEQAVHGYPYPGAGYTADDFLAHFAGQTGAAREAAIKNYAAMAR
jgi:hypothetical protein